MNFLYAKRKHNSGLLVPIFMNLNSYILVTIFLLSSFSYSGCQNLSKNKPVVEEADIEYLSKLPYKLRENSGIIKLKGDYWVLNDGGNGSFLYKIDPFEGTILGKIFVAGAKNHDWEEISQDAKNIYIGDIGNNHQKRKNLRIIILDKKAMVNHDTIQVSGQIHFKYEDQKKFPPNKKRNFNCEAFLSFGDSLYLFTKNYGDGNCNVYSISKDPKKQIAKKIGSFVSIARVTGAAKHPSGKYFILLAYEKKYSSPSIWVFKKEGNLSKIDSFQSKYFKLPIKAQAEAITHLKRNQFIITSEKGGSISARTFLLDLGEIFKD